MADRNTNKHLLIITPGFPADEQDTACLPALQQFLLSYQKTIPSTDITVLSLQYPYTSKAYTWHGITVYPMNGKNRTGLRKWMMLYVAMKKAHSISVAKKIDAVLSIFFTEASVVTKAVSAQLRVPMLIWVWGQETKAGNTYVKRVSPPPSQVAVMSEYQSAVFEHAYRFRPGHIIDNGINVSVFPSFNTGKRDIDILAVGSLIPLKRFHYIAELVKYLKDAGYSDIKAVIAGKGPEEQAIRLLIDKYNLQDNIRLTGEVSHNEVLNLMNNARILVHPSEYEGHSTVMLEALYSGCRVLSFIPVGSKAVAQAVLCTSLDEMKEKLAEQLDDNLTHERLLYTDIADSARQVNKILLLDQAGTA